MQPFETLPTTTHIKLIVRVYPLGGIDVRYAPEEGDAPMQRAALFGSRSALAQKFKVLGLLKEADMITDSDEQFHFTVAAWPEKRRILQSGSRLRTAIATSMPVIPGITTSVISISGWKLSSNSTTCFPLNTARASKPACLRMSARVVAIVSSSSTTITLRLGASVLPFRSCMPSSP
jgi:hypothetical protein